jgi:phosphatidylserine/phosphatidylglycerophosphate/cardiolipin synthase-like enzyme
MDQAELDAILKQTLDDARLSRSERRALGEVLADASPTQADLAWMRSRVFELARAELEGRQNHLVLDWVEDVVKVLAGAATPPTTVAEACFTPGDDAAARIAGLFASATRSVEACVFTITDDRLSRAILDAHRRGVIVRIITDDDKAFDQGSDVERLVRAGVQVRTDRAASHMHHKFAVFDGRLLLTGSYNWTRSACEDNHENFVVLDTPTLVASFSRAFEALWKEFRGG